MIKFTKKQQLKIDACTDLKSKQMWIEHFTHVQTVKQSPAYKTFIKGEREKERRYM